MDRGNRDLNDLVIMSDEQRIAIARRALAEKSISTLKQLDQVLRQYWYWFVNMPDVQKDKKAVINQLKAVLMTILESPEARKINAREDPAIKEFLIRWNLLFELMIDFTFERFSPEDQARVFLTRYPLAKDCLLVLARLIGQKIHHLGPTLAQFDEQLIIEFLNKWPEFATEAVAEAELDKLKNQMVRLALIEVVYDAKKIPRVNFDIVGQSLMEKSDID